MAIQVSGQQSVKLEGNLTVEQALTKLLQGTNLQVKPIGENKFSVLEGQPQPRNMGQLKTIDVKATGKVANDVVQLPVITVVAEKTLN